MAVAKHFGPVAACMLGNICAGTAQYLMTIEAVRVCHVHVMCKFPCDCKLARLYTP